MENHKRYWVMIVEDDPNHVLLIRAVFFHFDTSAHITVARSAEEAIASILGPWPDAALRNSELPDVIVLDINMAGIGGLGFLEWYAGEPAIGHVPVVVFTTSQLPGLRRRCFELGAREFKVKPTDFRELVPVVRGVLNLGDLEEKGPRTPPPSTARPSRPTRSPAGRAHGAGRSSA